MREKITWTEFKNKESSDIALTEKARKLAPHVCALGIESSEFLLDELRKKDMDFGSLFFEILCFNIHFINRIAFQYLDLQKRAFFMDKLFLEIVRIAIRPCSVTDEKKVFVTDFQNLCNQREMEYGRYSIYSTNDSHQRNTLFWEFGKKIAEILDKNEDIISILQIQENVLASLDVLNLPELLEK